MKKLSLTIALLVITLHAQAQFFNKSITGNGNKITRERSISNFDDISVAGAFNVTLIKTNSHQLSITTDENVLDYIVTEVKNNQLRIKVQKGYNLRNTTVKVEVPFKNLEEISLAGSGKIHNNSPINSKEIDIKLAGSGTINLHINTQEAECSIAGSGDVKLQGDTDELEVKVAGSGSCNSYKLIAEDVEARVAGSGDIKLFAKKKLDAKTTGSGTIYYRGNPEVLKTKSIGSGDIVKK